MISDVLYYARVAALCIMAISFFGLVLVVSGRVLMRPKRKRQRESALLKRSAKLAERLDAHDHAMKGHSDLADLSAVSFDELPPLGHDAHPSTGPRIGDGWKSAARYGASED